MKISVKELTDIAKNTFKKFTEQEKEKEKISIMIWCPYCLHWNEWDRNKKFLKCKGCKKKFKLGLKMVMVWDGFKIEKGKKKK